MVNLVLKHKPSPKTQFFVSSALVVTVAIICFIFSNLIGYKVVALILLLTVSVTAMLADILPVLGTAILSALIWNFFFIPPLFTFTIRSAEDLLMFLMYFIVALVNAVLSFKIRAAEKKARNKEEKENTIRLYNTLLNSLSHEIRTPLATIIGAVDTLQESSTKLSPNQQTELLSQIDTASIRLNRQVENLLNMSRLESGMLHLKLDWCDINELIFSVLSKLTSINSHTITFSPNENLPLFKLDGGLIEQVIHNIVYNALLYTPQSTKILITPSNNAGNCIIEIEDNGTGFPESELPYVFDKFYRVPNTKAGGSGLGLSIAKGFTEAHNGTIVLENNKISGAKFTIVIPAKTTFLNEFKNE